MKARSVVTSCVAAGVMLVVGAISGSANCVWCLSDPPIQVVTPGGHNLTVNNQVYLPRSALHLKNKIYDDATAAPDGHGGTLITVRVHVPDGVRAHIESSENRYQLSSQGDGANVITTYLDVPTS